MATSRNLRAAESILSSSRQQYIQSIEAQKQFEADCEIIIPDLRQRWEEKILNPFHLPSVQDLVPCPGGCKSGDEVNVPNWKHYLFNYRPQILSRAITRLASRLKLVNGKLYNARGPVENLLAYYKSVVQDLRKKERRFDVIVNGKTRPDAAGSDVEAMEVAVPLELDGVSNPFIVGEHPTCGNSLCSVYNGETEHHATCSEYADKCGIKTCEKQAADHSEFCEDHRPGITFGR